MPLCAQDSPCLRRMSPRHQWCHSQDPQSQRHCCRWTPPEPASTPAPTCHVGLAAGSPLSQLARWQCAELLMPVAWMPLGPNHDLRRQFWGFIYICSPSPLPCGAPALPQVVGEQPLPVSPLSWPWAPTP